MLCLLCSTRASPGRNRRAGSCRAEVTDAFSIFLRFLVSCCFLLLLLLVLVDSGRRDIRLPRPPNPPSILPAPGLPFPFDSIHAASACSLFSSRVRSTLAQVRNFLPLLPPNLVPSSALSI